MRAMKFYCSLFINMNKSENRPLQRKRTHFAKTFILISPRLNQITFLAATDNNHSETELSQLLGQTWAAAQL